MGGIVSGLFGSSKSKNQSQSSNTQQAQTQNTTSNNAYGLIEPYFSPMLPYANQGASALSAFLGGNTTGYNQYLDATGFDSLVNRGSRGITGNAAASGLLRSGASGMALADYANQMQQQYSQNYINNLLGLSGLGFQAGNTLMSGAGTTSTGNTSTSSQETSTSTGKGPSGGLFNNQGAMGVIGGGLSLLGLSDPRLKMNVEKIHEEDDGLGVYTFSYIWEDPDAPAQHIGVMADEVEELRPWALGPEVEGFKTVNYAQLSK